MFSPYNVIVLLFIFISNAFSAKVLFLCPVPTQSHQKVYQQVWTALSLRGHQVYAVTPNPVFNKSLTNLTEYDISEVYTIKDQITDPSFIELFFSKPGFFGMIFRQFGYKIISERLSQVYELPGVKKLFSEHDRFDICVNEWIFPSTAVYGYYFKCHVIGISSVGLQIPMMDTIGNPSHPIIAPDLDLPLPKEVKGFLDRAWSAFWTVYVRIFHRYVILPSLHKINIEFFGKDIPYLGDILNNVSLLIVNRNMAFHRPFPNLPTVIETAGLTYSNHRSQIKSDLKKYLDSSTNGVIYLSFGSSMNSSWIPQRHLLKLQKALTDLPFNILWKWEKDIMPNKPKNVFVFKWDSQVDILEHPNVKLFITQGGLQSLEEAIAAHKPIIGIPFHSDQTTNVDTCVRYGMGKMLDLEDLTPEILKEYILEIVNNQSYAENAKKLDILMKDQPQDGLEKAIWWIEYVIRHNGAKHLRSTAVELPWWQYLMLDVITFILFLTMALVLIIYFIIKISCKILWKIFLKLLRRVKSTQKYQHRYNSENLKKDQ